MPLQPATFAGRLEKTAPNNGTLTEHSDTHAAVFGIRLPISLEAMTQHRGILSAKQWHSCRNIQHPFHGNWHLPPDKKIYNNNNNNEKFQGTLAEYWQTRRLFHSHCHEPWHS